MIEIKFDRNKNGWVIYLYGFPFPHPPFATQEAAQKYADEYLTIPKS